MNRSVLTYRLLIDPLLMGTRKSIKQQIPAGSTCLDIACGTGSLVFSLAEGCRQVTGIDLDTDKITSAQKRTEIKGLDHLSFHIADATDLSAYSDGHFDVTTMVMALHQFSPPIRLEIIKEALRVSKKLIVGDYFIPLPKHVMGWAARGMEYLAGGEHHEAFLQYDTDGGLPAILCPTGRAFQLNNKTIFGVIGIWIIE